jgi:hypothetical protein
MKIALQYVNDNKGNTKAVQLPFADWQKILLKLEKYEQAFKLKSDLKEAYNQVKELRKSKKTKETLRSFLNDL